MTESGAEANLDNSVVGLEASTARVAEGSKPAGVVEGSKTCTVRREQFLLGLLQQYEVLQGFDGAMYWL